MNESQNTKNDTMNLVYIKQRKQNKNNIANNNALNQILLKTLN